jgi:hypothetical protein
VIGSTNWRFCLPLRAWPIDPDNLSNDGENSAAAVTTDRTKRLVLDRDGRYHLQQGKPDVTRIVSAPRSEQDVQTDLVGLRRDGSPEVGAHHSSDLAQ